MIDKKLMRTRFQKSLTTYAKEALVQKQMADRLTTLSLPHFSASLKNVLEIGCGTGLLTKKILHFLHPDFLVVNDIVPECETQIRTLNSNIHFLSGDFEKVPLSDTFFAILSNATLQWMEDFPQTIRKIARHLIPGGIFAFSTFTPNHFKEFKNLTTHTLDYFTKSETAKLLQAFFIPLEEEETTHILTFNSPRDVLLHLKKTGVTGISGTHWTPSKFEKFSKVYQKRFSLPSGKVSLTYAPQYHVWKKKL